MKRIVCAMIAGLAGAVMFSLLSSSTAFAHPLGNFTVNRYAGLLVQPDALSIEYVVDMAEIPTYQEISQVIDKNRDGVADEAENATYRSAKCAEFPAGLSLTLNGKVLAIQLVSTALEYPPGAGGLPTLRLTCNYRAGMAAAAPNAVNFRDSNFADRIGWREIVVQSRDVVLYDSNAPAESISHALRNYPNDLINNPPRQTQARFTFGLTPAHPISNAPTNASTTDTLDRTKDAFASLITVSDLNWQVILLSLLLAMGLGALHAVSPGHGKTIMAAYLVGARGTVAQACLLGLTVTATHTAGVLALGVITLFASRYILPESLYPLLSLTSGVLVIGMGIALAIDRWQILRHAGHIHTPSHSHTQLHPQQEEEIRIHGHSHLPSNLGGGGLSWKSLVGLGLVGGLVPSTSALILLLSAISLHRIPFGIVLIVAFGLGMAMVLVGVGVLLVRAGKLLEGKNTPAYLLAGLPVLSAIVVIGAGIVVSAGAWLQMGAWIP